MSVSSNQPAPHRPGLLLLICVAGLGTAVSLSNALPPPGEAPAHPGETQGDGMARRTLKSRVQRFFVSRGVRFHLVVRHTASRETRCLEARCWMAPGRLRSEFYREGQLIKVIVARDSEGTPGKTLVEEYEITHAEPRSLAEGDRRVEAMSYDVKTVIYEAAKGKAGTSDALGGGLGSDGCLVGMFMQSFIGVATRLERFALEAIDEGSLVGVQEVDGTTCDVIEWVRKGDPVEQRTERLAFDRRTGALRRWDTTARTNRANGDGVESGAVVRTRELLSLEIGEIRSDSWSLRLPESFKDEAALAEASHPGSKNRKQGGRDGLVNAAAATDQPAESP